MSQPVTNELTIEELDKVAGGLPITQGLAQGAAAGAGTGPNLLKKISDTAEGIIQNMK